MNQKKKFQELKKIKKKKKVRKKTTLDNHHSLLCISSRLEPTSSERIVVMRGIILAQRLGKRNRR